MFSSHSISKLAHKYSLAEGRLDRIKEEGEKAAGKVFGALEVAAGCAAASYANGALGDLVVDQATQIGSYEYNVKGVPVDAAAGVALFAAGLFNAGGKYSEHLSNLGAGGLASFVARKMTVYGIKRRAAQQAKPTAAGSFPAYTRNSPWGHAASGAFYGQHASSGAYG